MRGGPGQVLDAKVRSAMSRPHPLMSPHASRGNRRMLSHDSDGYVTGNARCRMDERDVNNAMQWAQRTGGFQGSLLPDFQDMIRLCVCTARALATLGSRARVRPLFTSARLRHAQTHV